jgi:choline trimethylamine-lyase
MPTLNAAQIARIKKLRNQVLQTPEICLDRGYWMTESYKETESDPPILARAKGLKKVLNNMKIDIQKGELLVGRVTSKLRGGPLLPEVAWEWYIEEMDAFSTREWNKYAPLTEKDKSGMKAFLPYWKGKSLFEKFNAIAPQQIQDLNHIIEEAGGHAAANIHQGHISVDFEEVLNKGLKGIKHSVNEKLSKLNLADMQDFEKYKFYTAVNITLEGASDFAKRYAVLAGNMVKKGKNAQRKSELEKIAEICAWVPDNPARTFQEALQSIWFVYVVLMIEGLSYGIGFGRPDQYLYPFYKNDLAAGRITDSQVRELIALLYIKINSTVIPICLAAARTHGGHPLTANITVGGLTKEGKNAVNELSYLFVDAETDVGLSGEDIIIRINKITPEAFVMKACEVAKILRGKLKFVSDDTIIQQLLTDGKPIQHARDYIIDGCDTPSVSGFSQDTPGALFNLPLMLELALNDGVSRMTGKQIGPKTGDPRKFKTYSDVWNAYKKQVETLMPSIILFRNIDDQLYAEFAPAPFQSALFKGCLEKGIDITNGGTAPYLTHAISLSGLPNVGDSLAAIKKVVFNDKKITMGKLIDALYKNFAGEEKIHQLLEKAPKFGNDDDYVDSIVNEVLTHGSDEAAKYKGIAGAKTTVAAHIITADIPMGKIVGALPDGRKAGEPLSEGGISPYQGRNISGPIATMRSVAKLDHMKLTHGSVLNMRFNPDFVKDDAKMRKFASILRTFCETGGALVQFNIIDTATLKDAQANPEKYKDLLVRVATYSAYFVELSPELQKDIIDRMEFGES